MKVRPHKPIALSVCVAALTAAAMAVGHHAAAPDSQVLIAQLADDSFAVREHAQKELIETGEPLVEQLRAALAKSADEEQRQRLDVVLKQISEDAILGPSRVTLDVRDAPLEEVIAEINRQVRHAPVSYAREHWSNTPGPRVTLAVRRQPLWSVLREICTQANMLDITPGDDGIRLSLGCGALSRAPCSVSGPMLIVASRIAHQETVEFTQGSHRTSDFSIHFAAIAEPKLKIMPGAAAVRLTEATDDRGNSMLAPGHVDETYGGGSPFWSFQTRLRYPDHPGTVIARLAGELTFTAASRFESMELTDWETEAGTAVRLGEFEFMIRRVVPQGENRYEVTVAAVAPPNDPDAYNRLQQVIHSADLRLFDADGRSILRSAGPNFTPAEHSNVIEMTSIFDRNLSAGRPAAQVARKVVWRVPIESKPVTIPFELTNLPMP